MNKRRTAFLNIIAYIVLIICVFAALFPVLFCLSGSLRTQQDLFANMFPFSIRSLIPTKIILDNYVKLFTVYGFSRPVFNTLVVTISTIVLGCFVNSIAGFAFVTFEFRGRKILYAMVLISFMVPFEAIAIPLYDIAGKLRLLDTYQGMVLPAIADGLVAFLFIQFFKDIPKALIDAARVDGAGWGKIYFRILLPMSVPIFVTAGLMIFMGQWNSYMWPLLVARSKEIRTIQLAVTAFSGERGTDWPMVYASSLFSAIIPMALFLPFQKYFVEGITAGSVKG